MADCAAPVMKPVRHFASRRLGKGGLGTGATLIAIGCLAISHGTAGASDETLPSCPSGWTVEVVATAPRILHPTAVACAPDGRVFVCEDYMDMPGPVDRPVNRILCVHPDGRVTVFADQIYVAFSMEYIDGKLYVHHCPGSASSSTAATPPRGGPT